MTDNRLRFLALAGAVTAALAVAPPAAADPPYAKPDLDVTTCYVVDDPIDYGDGVDWWKLHYTYVNEGYLASTGTFVVETAPVWKAGAGNAVVDTFVHGPMPRNQPVSKQFWVTRDVALTAAWSVRLDTGNDISESENDDNTCTSWYNPT
jgi:hypothetical protein